MKQIGIRISILLALFFPALLPAQSAQPLDSLLLQASQKVKAGQIEQSLELYLQGLRVAKKEQKTNKLAGIYYNLAAIQQGQQNYDKSREYTLQALHSARLTADSAYLGRSLLLYGILEYYAGRIDSSAHYFRQSATVFRAIGEQARAAGALAKVGNLLETQEKYAEATPYFEEQLAAARETGDTLHLMTAHINLGGNAYNLRNYQNALAHLKSAGSLARQINRLYEYQETKSLESLTYEAMGLPAPALSALREYVQVHDSILNTERSSQIAEMEARYETEIKGATIVRQEAELQQGRIRFWVIAGALLLALAVGGLLFRLTRILRRRNAEKEFLIKEIHHRVKNNLQILSSLLHLQSRQIKDESVLDAVREGQNRVEAMSLIHQKLYMGENVAAVEMQDYLHLLGNTLLESFGIEDRVQIRYDVAPLHLDVDTAIPLGLIVNELVTNSLKYAFPANRTGFVEIALWQDESQRLCLRVSDDGAGTHAATDSVISTAFGTKLVQMLSQKLKGKPEIPDQETGYSTVIRFETFRKA